MTDNKSNNIIQDTKPIKKKLRLKVILYILIILILLIFIATIYFKIKYYLDTKDKYSTKTDLNLTQVSPLDSINTNMLQEFLQKQEDFQKDVYNKIDSLSNEINKKQFSLPESDLIRTKEPSKVILLEKKQPTTEIAPKNNIKDNFDNIYYLIQALHRNNSFITELDSFKTMPEAQYFSQEISNLYNVASQGIPTNHDLALRFYELIPYIKMQSYKNDNSIWGKIKYYLSFLIIVQKMNNFNERDFSLDSRLYYIEKFLIEGKPENALYIVNNNLQNIKGLNAWLTDLNYRVTADNFAFKLQQFLLNRLHVEN